MPDRLSEIKRALQDHLQEGLLIVAGSGLSAAEGIPGMGALADHLKESLPPRLEANPDPAWAQIIANLDAGLHLEAAMENVNLMATTVNLIVEETYKLVLRSERLVFAKVFSGERTLPFSVFAAHLFKAGKKFHLITPNYDRLIELATEAAGIGVDCRFFGHLHGSSNPKKAADAHRESFTNGKHALFRPTHHLSIYKPHGSLDWYDVGNSLVKCAVETGIPPLIITPGISKYRTSFRQAFDDQRTSGNRAVAAANRFMFIGYGFNDDHLQEYLCPKLRISKPSVIVTKELSQNTLKLLSNSKGTQIITLSAAVDNESHTRVLTSVGDDFIINENLWSLEGFNRGVLL